MALPSISDISKARTNARQFGDGTAYALDFNVNGQNYTFVPNNVVNNGGVTAGDNTYLLPYFTSSDNLKSFNQNAQQFDLSSNSGLSNYLSNQGQSTTGYLIPSEQTSFDGQVLTQPTSTLNGTLSGLKNVGGQIVYGVSGGHGSRYLTTGGEVHDPYTESSSVLGNVFGSVGEDLSSAVKDVLSSPAGQIALAYSLPGVGAALGAELGVSAAVGTALASTAVQVANGADFETALKNATVTAIVTSGSPTVAKDITAAVNSAGVADAITSGGASIVSTLAKGGSMDDALKNAGAAIAASGASQAAQKFDLSQQTGRDIGAAVGGALTGGVTGAITGLAGELGRPTTDSTSTKTATPATDVAPSENAPVDKVTDPVVAAEPPVATDTTAIPQTNYVAPPAVAPRDTTTDIQVVDAINKEKASTPVAPAIATTIPETKLDPVDVATARPTPDISSTDVQVMDAIKKEATPAEPSVATTIPETKLPGVDVAATKPTPDISSTDVALLDAIKKETAPDVPVVPAKEVEPVTVTAPKPTPDIKSTDIQVEDTTQTPVDKAATPAEPAAETPAEPAPYKPDLFIYGGSGPSTLSQSLSTTFQAPYYPGAAPQGLTASRGAGEIEGVESGKKRKNVWNEASLRLKDALGL